MKKKILAVFTAISIAVVLFAGCGSTGKEPVEKIKTEVSVKEEKKEPAEEVVNDKPTTIDSKSEKIGTTDSQKNAVEEKETAYTEYSDKEIQDAYTGLMKKAFEFGKRNDTERIRGLFTEASDEDVENLINLSKDLSRIKFFSEEWPNQYFFIVYRDNGRYCCEDYKSKVDGKYPYTSSDWVHCLFWMRNIDGEWKFEGWTDENQTELIKAVYPEEMSKAREQGRNSFVFNNAAWMRKNIVNRGALDADLMYAYQNEDGSVTLMVNVKNGTYKERRITSASVQIEDSRLGTVLSDTFGDITVGEMSSKNVILTIPASGILTGTQKWGTGKYDMKGSKAVIISSV